MISEKDLHQFKVWRSSLETLFKAKIKLKRVKILKTGEIYLNESLHNLISSIFQIKEVLDFFFYDK